MINRSSTIAITARAADQSSLTPKDAAKLLLASLPSMVFTCSHSSISPNNKNQGGLLFAIVTKEIFVLLASHSARRAILSQFGLTGRLQFLFYMYVENCATTQMLWNYWKSISKINYFKLHIQVVSNWFSPSIKLNSVFFTGVLISRQTWDTFTVQLPR